MLHAILKCEYQIILSGSNGKVISHVRFPIFANILYQTRNEETERNGNVISWSILESLASSVTDL